MLMNDVKVIGGGLAGCEAAWQLAQRGCQVFLWEMRPKKMTPAHSSGELAELVCSNSLGAKNPDSAGGLLKAELQKLNSLIMDCAYQAQVPAGGALAVDRHQFAQLITWRITNHPNIHIKRGEWSQFPSAPAIIATGPLTSAEFSETLRDNLGEDMLFFYDAASPIIDAESIDYSKAFFAARYGKGGEDYLNCPMNQEEYRVFFQNLVEAKSVVLKDFEGDIYFEHCLPVEVIASRGPKTLTFGPLKPVGLVDPHTGQQPYAVVQLRKEDVQGQLFNMVGFQTNLTWGEQKRVFRMIPGLEKAEFVRYGVMHRNTFVHAPRVLGKNFQLQAFPGVYIAGQLSGVEGYLESTASGLTAALDLWANLHGGSVDFPRETLMGSLSDYVTRPNKNFQPMNANFGLLPPLQKKVSKRERRKLYVDRALEEMLFFAKD